MKDRKSISNKIYVQEPQLSQFYRLLNLIFFIKHTLAQQHVYGVFNF